MLNWFKRICCSGQPIERAEVCDADAKKFLANLRENELSVGAALRRGDAVTTAPGQATSSAPHGN